MDSLSTHLDYGSESLDESTLNPDPMTQFTAWLSQAEAHGVYEPAAMVLSSVDADGTPSSRTVLLRGVHPDGFEFFTDYESRKGLALAAEPRVSLLFPWYLQHRQVIVSGTAHRTTHEVSEAYFTSRPHSSRVAAVASEQSHPIADRAALEARMREAEARYPEGDEVPLPERWGGFRVLPNRFEFWQGRTSRLHDRIRYTRVAGTESAGTAGTDGWVIDRLQP